MLSDTDKKNYQLLRGNRQRIITGGRSVYEETDFFFISERLTCIRPVAAEETTDKSLAVVHFAATSLHLQLREKERDPNT